MADARLRRGTVVTATVTWREAFGIGIRLIEPPADGVVDLMYATQPDSPSQDLPPVGAQVRGVVQGYTPRGQLRVSLRPADMYHYGWPTNQS